MVIGSSALLVCACLYRHFLCTPQRNRAERKTTSQNKRKDRERGEGVAHLLALPTLERLRLGLTLFSTERVEQILLLDLLHNCLLLLRCHVLARHNDKLLDWDITRYHTLPELGVVLILEVDEQRADFVAVFACDTVTVVFVHGSLDFLSTLEDLLGGWRTR